MTRVCFIGLLCLVSVASGCWKTTETSTVDLTPSANAPVNANTVVAAPGQTVAPMPAINLPPATSNRELSGDTIADRANRKPRADIRPDATPQPLEFKPAPENSEMAVAMQPNGLIVETRVFKNHPTLARAELAYGKGERTLTVTLRDGRTATVKADKVEALRDIKAAQIIAMASK